MFPMKDSEFLPTEKVIIFLGFVNALGFSFQFIGQKFTSASKAALLVNLYVVWVVFLSKKVLKEKITPNKILALIFAVGGAYILVGAPTLSRLVVNKGDIFVGLAGLIWALYIVYSKYATKKLTPFYITRGVMIWTFLFILIFYPIRRWPIYPNLGLILFGAYLGIFCSILPYFLYTYGLKKITASASSFLLLIEVLMALLWSHIFLGEILERREFMGAILILLSLILTSLKEKEERHDRIQEI